MVLLLVGEARLHFLTLLCLLLYTSNDQMVICKPLQQNSNDRRRSSSTSDQYLMTIDSKLIIDQNLAKLMNFRRMLNEKLLIDSSDQDLIQNLELDDQQNFDQPRRSISKNHHHHHKNRRTNNNIRKKSTTTFDNDLLNELLMADSGGQVMSEKSLTTNGRTFRINANLNSQSSSSTSRNNQRMMDRSSSGSSKSIVRRNDAPFAASGSDGYSTECPKSRDKPHQIMCPSRRKHGYHVCIDETALCNGVPDCPQGEDENPSHCMFYKTSMRYFKTVVDQVVQLSDTVLRMQSRQNDEL